MANCKKTCSCEANLNFGVKATTNFGVATRLGIMDYINSDDEVNFLPLNVAWDKSFWDGKKANADFTKRLHLTPNASEVAPAVEDDVTQSLASGEIISIRDGVATYEFHYYFTDATFYNAMKSRKCLDNGVFFFDACGSTAGHVCEENKFEVVRMQPNSLQVQYIPATLSTAAYTRVRFNLDLNESQVFDIVDDIEYSISKIRPLYDGRLAETPATSTTTQLVAKLEPVTAFTSRKGLVIEGVDTPANWTITDSAGATSNTTTVAESPAGTYTMDYLAIAAGDTEFYYLDENVEIRFTVTVA